MKTDAEIRTDVEAELRWTPDVDDTGIAVTVHGGVLTLTGFTPGYFDRYQAEAAAKRVAGVKLAGVTSVKNSIQIAPGVVVFDIKQKIEAAFRRSAAVDADRVTIDAAGSEVTLRGEVRSWAERDQAQMAAWAAPGVTLVINEIEVRT